MNKLVIRSLLLGAGLCIASPAIASVKAEGDAPKAEKKEGDAGDAKAEKKAKKGGKKGGKKGKKDEGAAKAE